MENILKLINELFAEDKTIQLKRNGSCYQYIGISETKINGIKYESISYEISQNNSKRVTKEFLIEVFNFYNENQYFPNIDWYKEHFALEIISRPCNKSVAENFIAKLTKLK
jgi:hypothetical protein